MTKLQRALFLYLPLLLMLGFSLPTVAGAQSPVAGDWQGEIAYGPGIHLALHITGTGDALKGTMDSIDQNAFGIPLDTITFKAPTLTFTAKSLKASWTGTLSTDGSLIGKMTQGGATLPLTFMRVSSPAPSKAEKADAGKSDAGKANASKTDAGRVADSIIGAWSGSLDIPAGKLPIVLHFAETSGKLSATLDSPQQGAYGVPVPTVSRAGDALHMAFPKIGATFDGSFSPDRQMLTGTWTQGGTAAPITLTRGAASTAAPQ